MIRKTTAVSAALGLALLALPVAPAFASASSTARLTTGTAVYPGANSYSIAVTNNEAGGLLGSGKTINAVRINFPVNEAGIEVTGTAGTAPSGWTATVTKVGTTQFITYRGGSLAPGATTTFNFPASVVRPQSSDRTGDFRVQVSSDNFQTASSAPAPVGSTLLSKVQVLEILDGTVKPLAPFEEATGFGVRDRSGTAGQRVTYGLTVKNHAQNDLVVTPALAASPTSDDMPQAAGTTTVKGNDATADLPVDVVLGSAAPGGQRSTLFTASATGRPASTMTPTATAPSRTDTFTVQAPVTFTASGLTPVRTKSGELGSARDFKLTLAKAGVQRAVVDTSTLTFGQNSASKKDLAFVANAASREVTYSFLKVLGAPGSLAATVANEGRDDNLAPLNADPIGAGAITIDNLAPKVTVDVVLPADVDGDQKVASSNNDTITVSGTVLGEKDVVDDTLAVKLTTDNGQSLPVTVSRTATADGFNFRGSVNVGTWKSGAQTFTASASVADQAENVGDVTSLAFPIDVLAPVLREPAQILTPTTIEMKFLDPSGVRGGCDPSAYSVDGRPGAVVEVRGNGSAPCDPRLLSDGIRTLVLADRAALSPTETPRITYTALNRALNVRPAKDGAGNDAVSRTVNSVTDIRPLAPVLTRVERKDGGDTGTAFEAAYQDPANKAYYTNAGGQNGNRVTVSGIRNGYTLQVRDAAGRVLKDQTFNNTSPLAPSEFSGSIDLPVGDAEATYDRFLVFLSGAGNLSDPTPLQVVLDKTTPLLASSTLVDPKTVRAGFDEPIVVGTDFADDWFVSEKVKTESGAEALRTVNANSVKALDSRTRELTVDLADPAAFARADYFFQSSGVRYEDRAGNKLLSTLS